MIGMIPRNKITLSVFGTFWCLGGFGALTQGSVVGFFLLEAVGALSIFMATKEPK